jgi:hypothetical protein
LDIETAKAAAAHCQAFTVSQMEAALTLGSARLFESPIAKPHDILFASFIGVAV